MQGAASGRAHLVPTGLEAIFALQHLTATVAPPTPGRTLRALTKRLSTRLVTALASSSSCLQWRAGWEKQQDSSDSK